MRDESLVHAVRISTRNVINEKDNGMWPCGLLSPNLNHPCLSFYRTLLRICQTQSIPHHNQDAGEGVGEKVDAYSHLRTSAEAARSSRHAERRLVVLPSIQFIVPLL